MQQHTSTIAGALVGAIMNMGAVPDGTDAKKIADEIAEIVQQAGNDLVAQKIDALNNQLVSSDQPSILNSFGATPKEDNSDDVVSTNHLADDAPSEMPKDLLRDEAPPVANEAPVPKPAAQDPGYIGDEENESPNTTEPQTPEEYPNDTSTQDPANPTSKAQNNVGQVDDAAQEESSTNKRRTQFANSPRQTQYSKQNRQLDKEDKVDEGQMKQAQGPIKKLDAEIKKKEREKKKYKLLIAPLKVAWWVLIITTAVLFITIFFIPAGFATGGIAVWVKHLRKPLVSKVEKLDEEIKGLQKKREQFTKVITTIRTRVTKRNVLRQQQAQQ